MPSRRVHVYIDLIFLGRRFWLVHRRMDSMWVVMGRAHRLVYHDWASSMEIARCAYPKDQQRAISSAWLHITTDYVCSANPWLKKILEAEAREYFEERKRRKRNRRRVNGEFDRQSERVDNFMRAQRLRPLLGANFVGGEYL